MTFSTSDLRSAVSSATTLDLQQPLLHLDLIDRRDEAMLAAAYEVDILTIDRSNAAGATSTRNSDWATATELAQSEVTLQADQFWQMANKLYRLDARRLPLNYVETYRSAQVAAGRRAINANIRAYRAGLTYGTGAGNSHAISGAGTFDISDNAFTDPDGSMVFDALADINDYLLGLGAIDGSGDAAGTPFAIMGTPAWRNLAEFLIDKNIYADGLYRGLIERGGIFGLPNYRGRLNSIDIFVDPGLPAATASAGLSWYAGLRPGIRGGVAPPGTTYVAPESNLTGSYHFFGQELNWGRLVVEPDLCIRVNHSARA